MSSVDRIAEAVRKHLPDGSGAKRRAALRARLIVEADDKARTRSRLVAVGVGACLACAATVALLVVLVLPAREGAISCLRDGRAPVDEGTWITASSDRPVQLLFSERSEMVLAPETNARVVELTPERVRVLVEAGDVDLRITTGGERDWVLDAGPFSVRVTGTVFGMSWTPSDQQLRVEVREGEVETSGGPLGERVVPVRAGERFQASGASFEVAALSEESQRPREGEGTAADTAPASSRSDGEAPIDPGDHDLQAPAVGPQDPRGDGRGRRSSWRALARAGDHEAAADEAERIGIERLARDLDARSAILLADTLRLTDRDKGAKVVLVEIRRRFPRRLAAQAAAFRLGRIAADHGRHEEALAWFSELVDEAPGSDLAEKALGRTIEAHLALGNRSEARRQAAVYLGRHPRGSYASAAEELLSETGDR
jgi:ferric-dicitrate binding protein FerR (iron transport regulator)